MREDLSHGRVTSRSLKSTIFHAHEGEWEVSNACPQRIFVTACDNKWSESDSVVQHYLGLLCVSVTSAFSLQHHTTVTALFCVLEAALGVTKDKAIVAVLCSIHCRILHMYSSV